jgi:hypothetical protein
MPDGAPAPVSNQTQHLFDRQWRNESLRTFSMQNEGDPMQVISLLVR